MAVGKTKYSADMLNGFGVIIAAALAMFGAPPAAHEKAFTSCFVRTKPTRYVPGGVAPADLTAALSVLRNPITSVDAVPRDVTDVEFRVVYQGASRFLGSGSRRQRYWAVVGRRMYIRLPRRCLRHLSPHARREAQAEARREHDLARTTALYVIELDADGSGADDTRPFDLERLDATGGIVNEGAEGRHPRYWTVAGLVPDGVTSVLVHGHAGPPVAATVVNNFFSADVPIARLQVAVDHGAVVSVTWLSQDGSVLSDHRIDTSRPQGG